MGVGVVEDGGDGGVVDLEWFVIRGVGMGNEEVEVVGKMELE